MTVTKAGVEKQHVVAHRGDPRAHAENTLAAITHAVTDGHEVIEVDARLSSDGDVVLLHDDTLERVWGKAYFVEHATTLQLRGLTPEVVGHCRDSHGVTEGVPTLEEALDAVGTAVLLIDFPDHPSGAGEKTARAVARVMQELIAGEGAHPAARRDAARRAEFTGGVDALRVIRSFLPHARLRLTFPLDSLPEPTLVSEIRPYSWNPPAFMCTAENVREAAHRGVRTTCWTVDDPEVAQALFRVGVHSVTSNEPSKIRHALPLAQPHERSLP